MRNKKGVELSMNLIIIAAIALLVLVILAILVLRGSTGVTQGTGCAAKAGGQCVAKDAGCGNDANGNAKIVFPAPCPDVTPKCCINNPIST